jgi:hypothetical protein
MEGRGGPPPARGSLPGAIRGAVLIVSCALVAYAVANLVDLGWPGTLLRGRDFRAIAILAAALIAVAGLWWALARRHGSGEMLASLLLVEALLAALIVVFSGSLSIDAFFADWFVGVNLYLALPWLLAVGVSFMSRRART